MSRRDGRNTSSGPARPLSNNNGGNDSCGAFEMRLRGDQRQQLSHGPVRILMQDGKPANKVIKTFKGQKV